MAPRLGRLLACFALCAVLVPAGALGDRGDPKKAIRPADQKRAKAMIVRTTDLLPGFERYRSSSSSDTEPYCKELDESDLTITGEVEAAYRAGSQIVLTAARVYRTRSEANASYRRNTSTAGLRCMRRELGREFAQNGGKLLSVDLLPFPRLGDRTYVRRFVARQGGVTVTMDRITVHRSRAWAGVGFVSGVAQVPRAEQVRLARVIADRMATAMRGA